MGMGPSCPIRLGGKRHPAISFPLVNMQKGRGRPTTSLNSLCPHIDRRCTEISCAWLHRLDRRAAVAAVQSVVRACSGHIGNRLF